MRSRLGLEGRGTVGAGRVSLGLGLAAAVVIAVACGASDGDPQTTATDAGGGTGRDGAADAAVDAEPCAPANPVAAPFSEWVSDGNTELVDGDVALLTPSAGADSAGAIAWPEPHVFERFDATFEVRIKPGAPPGEGLVFAWSPAPPPATGAGAANMGACGLGGYGVAFDTAPDAGASGVQVKLLRLEGINGCPNAPVASGGAPASFTDNAFHPVRVELSAGTVKVSIDGAAVLTGALPGYTPIEGYVFFTAATSSRTAEHAVKAPRIDFPLEPRCP